MFTSPGSSTTWRAVRDKDAQSESQYKTGVSTAYSSSGGSILSLWAEKIKRAFRH